MMKSKKRVYSRGSPLDYMSADQLKSQFYEYFHDSGTFADLQAQLRSKLIHEMFKISSNSNNSDIKEEDVKDDSQLPMQVCNWLVYDHLKRLKYEYSLSTFVTEASLPYPKNLLSIKDVLHIFGISTETSEYETIFSSYINKSNASFLHSFLSTILLKKSTNSCSQNLSKKSESTKVVNKTNFDDLSPGHYNSSQVINSTSNHDDQYFQTVPRNDNAYFHQMLQLEKEKYEREINLLRQKLLVEIDALYSREQQSHIEMEQKKLKLIQEQETFNLQKEHLEARESELNAKLQGIDVEVETKVKHLKENLLQKKRELELKESELNEKQKRFEKEQIEVKSKSNEFETFEMKYHQLQQSYKFLQDDYATILKENEQFKMEIKNMSDYSVIKEEVTWKSKKLEHLEKELILLKLQMQEEKMTSLNTIQKFQQQLLTDKPNMSFIPRYMDTAAAAGDMLHVEDEKVQKKNLEAKGDQGYQELLSKIEDQNEDIRELHRLIHRVNHVNPQKRDQGTSPIHDFHSSSSVRLVPKETPLINRDSNLGAIPKIPSISFAVQHDTEERLSTYYRDARKKLNALLDETAASEQRFCHYIASQPKLFPNTYTSLKISPYLQNSDIKKSVPSVKSFSESGSFTKPLKDFDHEFHSKVSSFKSGMAKVTSHFDTLSYATQHPVYTLPNRALSYDTNQSSSKNFNTSSKLSDFYQKCKYYTTSDIHKDRIFGVEQSKDSELSKANISTSTKYDTNTGKIIDSVPLKIEDESVNTQSPIETFVSGKQVAKNKINHYKITSVLDPKEDLKHDTNYEEEDLYQKSKDNNENSVNEELQETPNHSATQSYSLHVPMVSISDKREQISEKRLEDINNKMIAPTVSSVDNAPVDLDALWKKQKSIEDSAGSYSNKAIFTANEEEIHSPKNIENITGKGTSIGSQDKSTSHLQTNENKEISSIEDTQKKSLRKELSKSSAENTKNGQVDLSEESKVKDVADQLSKTTSVDSLKENESQLVKNTTLSSRPTPDGVEDDKQISTKINANEIPNEPDISSIRNTASEMSSSELDDKGPIVSELSDLNLSAGSELEKSKNSGDEDDGW